MTFPSWALDLLLPLLIPGRIFLLQTLSFPFVRCSFVLRSAVNCPVIVGQRLAPVDNRGFLSHFRPRHSAD
jgi:hypothetical protein